jgi:large subunit ribosomal protein L13
VDHGDYVVVINAGDVVLTGKKEVQKLYRWHSGYPGGLKSRSARQMLKRRPEEVLRNAVYGMLPKNKMRVNIARKLKIFADSEYPQPHKVKTYKNGRVTGYVHLLDPPISVS